MEMVEKLFSKIVRVIIEFWGMATLEFLLEFHIEFGYTRRIGQTFSAEQLTPP